MMALEVCARGARANTTTGTPPREGRTGLPASGGEGGKGDLNISKHEDMKKESFFTQCLCDNGKSAANR
jgi:hypothetical protein